jgi:MYXO-CTERM domain-containing protein
MPSPPLWTAPPAALAVLAVVMLLAWRRQRATRDAGIVDLVWSASLGALALVYAALAGGWAPRRWLVAGLVALGSLRLSLHLARRLSGEAHEDGRYLQLREELGDRFDRWMLWFFQAQALLAVLLSLAWLPSMAYEREGWRLVDLAAALLWLAAIAGEALADRQLAAWRADPANAGRTCRRGLWRFSRHPNYFFEWLTWLAWPLFALGAPYGLAAWLAPALMLFLILRVTGVPPTEARALRSRGDDYREYQRTTNAFFPGPRKGGAALHSERASA